MAELFEQCVQIVEEYFASGGTIKETKVFVMYGEYQQATVGPVETESPTDPYELRKWNAWYSFRQQTQEEAKRYYVETFRKYFPAEIVARLG